MADSWPSDYNSIVRTEVEAGVRYGRYLEAFKHWTEASVWRRRAAYRRMMECWADYNEKLGERHKSKSISPQLWTDQQEER